MAAAAADVPSKLPSPPPYSEMILAAIAALDEKSGSSKSAISKHIDLTYGELLPASHQALLAAHLARMKESGELVMVKNNYMRQGPDAPLKRGRGRPPKVAKTAATPVVEEAVEVPLSPELGPPTPRPRGRPPKSKVDVDPLAAAVAKAATGFPRPRGRPSKKARPEAAAPASAADVSAGNPGSVKRGRGRPPKVKPQFADVDFA